ncbi:MAG TPA: UDP-N-acetylmuramate--L-alanine ligase, partial [Candidatus Sulfotelmatobacter sp.]|nr:UDP-N-acetylmuramate--L-alanine ligase [Candidatus Sulfotelmatobacter sp.]
GGIGMSGIAEVLLNLGYKVSGSDLKSSAVTERLARLGATIFEGHRAENIAGAEVVVTSSAIAIANPEVTESHRLHIPVIQRAEMLAELMRLKYGIAIAGMHGKTTTTSMVAAVLAAGGLDPTVVVGGRVDAMGSNARLGKSQYLVAEADESDRSFLKLSPILSVVTNIDREHMDCYRNMRDVKKTFVEFMDRVPFYGMIVACNDDPLLRRLLPEVQRRTVTYGTKRGSDFWIKNVPTLAAKDAARVGHPSQNPREGRSHNPHFSQSRGEVGHPHSLDAPPLSRFTIRYHEQDLGEFTLHVPGAHNVLNATAAIAVGVGLDINFEYIRTALNQFRGVDRRFQLRGRVGGVSVIDDYGHHPTEIKATLAAARQCGFGKIHVIFQPHRYTRTRDLMDEFTTAFADADSLFVLDIYAASEQPIEGITGDVLARHIREKSGKSVEYVSSFADAVAAATASARDGDMILTLGAGSVSQLGPMLLDKLKEREAVAARGFEKNSDQATL